MRYLPNLTDRLWAGEQLITDSKNRDERVRHVTERETYGTTARVASLYTREWRHARPIMHQSENFRGHDGSMLRRLLNIFRLIALWKWPDGLFFHLFLVFLRGKSFCGALLGDSYLFREIDR